MADPAWHVVVKLFHKCGVAPPTVRLRDELAVLVMDSRELRKLSDRLGEGADTGSAWESLEVVLCSLRKLTAMARTSGGTAGPDTGLMAACVDAEEVLANLGPDPL